MTEAEQTNGVALSTSEDLVLLASIRASDRNAFQVLFRRYRTPVYWSAFTILRSPADSEEIAQDVFITMWSKRSSIEVYGESALPWLITTARFLALNRLRHIRRRRTDDIENADQIADSRPSPEETALATEAMTAIENLVAAMPQVDQDIFQLCLLEDLTYKEAAARLRVSHASVRNRLARLKQRLRTELRLLTRGE